MLPSHRLRLIIARSLHGVPPSASPADASGDLHDYLLEGYIRQTCTNEMLTDLLQSVSSLGIATQEDWLRLKKICFAHLPELPCRTVNRLFALLVENDACGQVECVKLQNNLAQPDFSRTLRSHERLQALRSIANVGSRLSPAFTPYALEAIQHLVKECQVELLPTLSYSVGRLFTSKENSGISFDVQHSLLDALLARVESMDFMLLTQSELIYLLWILSTFLSSMESIQPMYLRATEAIMTRGFQMDELKRASPFDLLLMLCSLCPLLSLSGLGTSLIASQEEGLIAGVLPEDFKPCVISQLFFKQLLVTTDVVLSALLHVVASGELQNTHLITTLLEMITCSGVTRALKNAQILSHLLLRTLMYSGLDAWFSTTKDFSVFSGEECQKPLVNFYAFNKKVKLLDRLAVRLSFSVSPSVSVHGLRGSSVQESVAILEALVHSHLSEHHRRKYLEACLIRLPYFIRSASKTDFLRMVRAVKKLRVSNSVIERSIQDRSHELGLVDYWINGVTTQLATQTQNEMQEPSRENWDADNLSLCICEKALDLLEESERSIDDVPELVGTLSKQRGLGSATQAHCVSILRSLSTRHLPFKGDEPYRAAVTSLFTRVETSVHVKLLLSLIADGAKVGVSRTALLDCLSWVGTQLHDEKPTGRTSRDVAAYLVAAHELDALDTAAHPSLIGALQREDQPELFCPRLGCRLFGALCALGVDDKSQLGRLLTLVTPWCSTVIARESWSEKDWKAIFVLIYSLWSPSSEVVKQQLLHLAYGLVPVMIKRCTDEKTREYPLHVLAAAATLFICDERFKGIAMGNSGEEIHADIIPGFLDIMISVFSEDGVTLSLPRANALLGNDAAPHMIPQCTNILCLLIAAHAMQRLAQTNNSSSRRLTSLGVSLWRYSLKRVEMSPTIDNSLLNVMGFSIQFGASSQSFDRFMSHVMETEGPVNMLFVCSVADGLVRTGRRRPIATQLVAHFTQRSALDDLPAAALLSLLKFFTRDAEKVALGLARTDMLVSLLWSSLSLKMDRLPCTRELWKLVETVPVNVAPLLLQLFCHNGLINMSSAAELLCPVSIVLAWQTNAVSTTVVTEFLRKVEASLNERQGNEPNSDVAVEEIRRMISGRLY